MSKPRNESWVGIEESKWGVYSLRLGRPRRKLDLADFLTLLGISLLMTGGIEAAQHLDWGLTYLGAWAVVFLGLSGAFLASGHYVRVRRNRALPP